MADYIEREAAIKIVEKYGTGNGGTLGRHSGVADYIVPKIAVLSAADVAPVRHGEWIPISDGEGAECGECGKYFHLTNCAGSVAWLAYQQFRRAFAHCPCCGAKMDRRR